MCQSKVSVIIPCYNHGQYIEESLNSVLEQTYNNIEIIIVNDGSTDEFTNNLLATLVAPRTTVIRTKNRGPAAARNIGIESSTGDYILPLDADDKIDKQYVEKSVKILDENKKIKIVYCKARLFGGKNIPWELPSFSIKRMLRDNIIFSSAFFRRQDFLQVGGYNTNMEHGLEDWDFWLSILETDLDSEVYQIPEELFFYRKEQVSRSTKIDNKKLWVLRRTIYLNHVDLYSQYFHDPLNLYYKIKDIKKSNKKKGVRYYKKKLKRSFAKRYAAIAYYLK